MEKETDSLNACIDNCLRDSPDSHSTVEPLQEPFLNFDPNSELSFEDKSAVYNSLVALVKTDYHFNNALQDRAIRFLRIICPKWDKPRVAAKLVTDLVPSSAGSTSGFIASILTLLSSPHSTVVAAALSFLKETKSMTFFGINKSLYEWKKEGPEVVLSGKRMMQALFSECFEDTLEQMTMNNKGGNYGRGVVTKDRDGSIINDTSKPPLSNDSTMISANSPRMLGMR
ncbi:hypothetical protein BLNAU_7229 [Blattamonas nauphoetae]|uniref:CLASP N-terminal domain-containing protein n=1 Tax=Blattamonas nauphoetae TaxID=2049346 RepID=A0ABQ9Y218_9EUKA|nr:hypothetical protein BLNAU_7229 [Blattamonas nauphoetae]